METAFFIRLSLIALQLLLQTQGSSYGVSDPDVFFFEGNRIVLTGEFKNVKKIILCDDKFLDKCGLRNEQKILMKGQTQILLEISTYPWNIGEPVWYHPVPSTRKEGYRFIIGMIYDRATPITRGGY
jgi:hypothetical protein